MRTKRFTSLTWVARSMLPEADRAVRAEVLRTLADMQVGPRGGHYEPFGETIIDTAEGEDFSVDRVLYRGRRWAEYVRPHR